MPAGDARTMAAGRRTVEQADGILPVIVRVETEFAQNHLLHLTSRLMVSRVDDLQVFPSSPVTHRSPPSYPPQGHSLNGGSGYTLNGSTALSEVANQTAR